MFLVSPEQAGILPRESEHLPKSFVSVQILSLLGETPKSNLSLADPGFSPGAAIFCSGREKPV